MWLFENTDLRIEGRIIGFDEYMNLVLDEAEELSIKKKSRKVCALLAGSRAPPARAPGPGPPPRAPRPPRRRRWGGSSSRGTTSR